MEFWWRWRWGIYLESGSGSGWGGWWFCAAAEMVGGWPMMWLDLLDRTLSHRSQARSKKIDHDHEDEISSTLW